MYIQPETIVEQYELSVSSIVKGRGTYICKEKQGDWLLIPYKGSMERAQFLRAVMAYLNEAGCPVEQILLTKEGLPIAKDELDGGYLLKESFGGTECNIKNKNDLREAVESLARLHVALAACPIEIPAFMLQEKQSIVEIYKKHYKELVKLKNYIKTKTKKNEFETIYKNHYNSFIDCANRSIAMLETFSMENNCLCHGDFNQHNVVKTEQGMRIIHLENLAYHLNVVDLVNFLRKAMEKNAWDANLGIHMILWYQAIAPVTKEEYWQIYALLLFPEKFWKIANHYFNSHKAWVSGRDIDKINKVILQEEARLAFLEKLFSFLEESDILKA